MKKENRKDLCFLLFVEGKESCTEKNFFDPIVNSGISSQCCVLPFNTVKKDCLNLTDQSYQKLKNRILHYYNEFSIKHNNTGCNNQVNYNFYIICDDDLKCDSQIMALNNTKKLLEENIKKICCEYKIDKKNVVVVEIFDCNKSFEFFLCIITKKEFYEPFTKLNKNDLYTTIKNFYGKDNPNFQNHKKKGYKFWKAINSNMIN